MAEAAAPDMSLDAFMATHTSEDNASFAEILEGINKRKRERHAWLHTQVKDKEKEVCPPFPPPQPHPQDAKLIFAPELRADDAKKCESFRSLRYQYQIS